MKTFALALGSGGARGLAHIAVIEALDEMGVKPLAIAGASVGALIGAAYAAGMSGKDIRHHVLAIAHHPRETRRRLLAARAGRLSDLLSGAFSQATQMDAEKFCAQFLPEAIPADFSALAIPLVVMATDLHRRQEAALSSGPLRTALAASMAFPGLFRPVGIDGRILVDGGATNPLPFDQLSGRADAVIAVEVFGAAGAGTKRHARRVGERFHHTQHHGLDYRRRQTPARRTRPRAPPQCLDLPHARLLPGERDFAHRRGGEERSEGKARQAA